MQGVPHGCTGSRIVSNSCALHDVHWFDPPGPLVKHELHPDSDGNRQSLCPAKLAAFSWLTQSHTVVIDDGTWHVPSPPAHCSQPVAQFPGSVCALHAVS